MKKSVSVFVSFYVGYAIGSKVKLVHVFIFKFVWAYEASPPSSLMKKSIISLVLSSYLLPWSTLMYKMICFDRFVYKGYRYSGSECCDKFWFPQECWNLSTQGNLKFFFLIPINVAIRLWMLIDWTMLASWCSGGSVRKVWTSRVSCEFDNLWRPL